MKISRTWLQNYFDTELPPTEVLAEKFTFHAFEVEETTSDMIDLKVLPDRAAYALCHRGIAKELSAILDIPLKKDPLKEELPEFSHTRELVIEADHEYVVRHTGALIKNVTVKESPTWLKQALEAVGQRSINNIVDALNYILLDIGQPSGAFDLNSLTPEEGVYKIRIRRATEGEKIKVLTGEEYTLTHDMFAFTDAVSGELLDIAGIKGGLSSGVTEKTTDIFLSVGNYDGTLIRRASQKLKLFTDASLRYQNRPSPELTTYGMRDLISLIQNIAGGELVGVIDDFPHPMKQKPVSVSRPAIESLLGAPYSHDEVRDAFERFGFSYSENEDVFTVTPPFERNDIAIPEDLIEEVGRLYGYERIKPVPLKSEGEVDQARFRGIEKIKDALVSEGFIEVSTQSFAKKGDIKLANPLDTAKPYLRTSFEENLKEAHAQAKRNAPLYNLNAIKLFEVGTIFTKKGEQMVVGTSSPTDVHTTLADDQSYTPKRYTLKEYEPFSVYPFILRDIAVWTPSGTKKDSVESIIRDNAGEHLMRIDCFDTFEKEERISYAFHLVFQSFEKTLSDEEINPQMEKISQELSAQNGFEVR